MGLTKFVLPPDNSSYSVTDGKQVVSVQLDGGAGRYRRDILGATSRVSCSWILGREDYKYLRSFFRTLTVSGSKPFLIDLILDEATLTEHKVYFVPDSMQLTAQKGLTYWVSAQLEAYPAEVDSEADLIYAVLYGEYGSNWKTEFPITEDLLNLIMNTYLPDDL